MLFIGRTRVSLANCLATGRPLLPLEAVELKVDPVCKVAQL